MQSFADSFPTARGELHHAAVPLGGSRVPPALAAAEAVRMERTRVAAYYIAERSGFTGEPLDCWLAAERELQRGGGGGGVAAATAAASASATGSHTHEAGEIDDWMMERERIGELKSALQREVPELARLLLNGHANGAAQTATTAAATAAARSRCAQLAASVSRALSVHGDATSSSSASSAGGGGGVGAAMAPLRAVGETLAALAAAYVAAAAAPPGLTAPSVTVQCTHACVCNAH